jgi:hypothetical protein
MFTSNLVIVEPGDLRKVIKFLIESRILSESLYGLLLALDTYSGREGCSRNARLEDSSTIDPDLCKAAVGCCNLVDCWTP